MPRCRRRGEKDPIIPPAISRSARPPGFGRTLELEPNPDRVVDATLYACPHCAAVFPAQQRTLARRSGDEPRHRDRKSGGVFRPRRGCRDCGELADDKKVEGDRAGPVFSWIGRAFRPKGGLAAGFEGSIGCQPGTEFGVLLELLLARDAQVSGAAG